MVQLSGIGFYASQAAIQAQDESMDFDPNNFLMKKEIKQDPYQQQSQYQEANDGYEYATGEYNEEAVEQQDDQQQQQQDYYPTSFAQQFAPSDFTGLIQIPEHEPQEEMSVAPVEAETSGVGGGGLEDLDISDSDEEQPNLKMEIFNNDPNANREPNPDEQGLWF